MVPMTSRLLSLTHSNSHKRNQHRRILYVLYYEFSNSYLRLPSNDHVNYESFVFDIHTQTCFITGYEYEASRNAFYD